MELKCLSLPVIVKPMVSSNRTFMELKFPYNDHAIFVDECSNRTFMELKCSRSDTIS